MKKILGIVGNNDQHWVGDGFPVRTLFSYDRLGAQVSPFLLFDYAVQARAASPAPGCGSGLNRAKSARALGI